MPSLPPDDGTAVAATKANTDQQYGPVQGRSQISGKLGALPEIIARDRFVGAALGRQPGDVPLPFFPVLVGHL